MASSSSYNSSPKWTYDVFLSFRGEDTRKNFVDHLYTALGDRGIYTFKDDSNLKRGQSISPELIKAIEESRFAVVIFSRNYADSSWCLDELVKIVDCKNSMDQTLVPVFYDVDPSEVGKQAGCYEKAFAKHEINGKEEDRIQTWRNALAEAAGIAGWYLPHTANGYESVCIKQIVGHVLAILGCGTTLSIAENLIGVESRMLKVKSLLSIGSNDVQILGIWGMGGLGKTTIARAVFDNISNQFERRSFVANVREVSKSSGLHSLQEKILSEILMERDLKVRSVDEGIIVMKRLFHKKVLLVLDDVDQLNQLEALAGKRDWFGKGSRIIITTRDKHLLVAHGVKQIHKIVLLNDDEALLLFSQYAFQSKSPLEEYVEPSRLVVRNAGGLPLALKVSGSFLCSRGLDVWKSTPDILKHVPDNEIVDILKISFDGLKHTEKEMFLDIACFFIGMKKDDVSKILDSSDFYPDIVISVLEQKSLITVSKGIIQMHDLIRHMGLHIVQQTDPGRRTRVWLPKDADAVFTDDKGTEAIETIKLDYRTKMRFTSESFRNMNKLRLLHVSSDCETGLQGPEYLPNELRWICWHKFPSESLPASYQGEKLICLDMPFSNIIQLWKAKKILDKLKFIDLSNSDKLISTPDFSGVPNLERLILRGCTSLKEVHPSLGDLKRLIVLDFSTCERLTNFSSDFNMTCLEIFILSGCSKLKVFPKIIGNMERLRELYLGGTMIQRLHSSIGKLTGLVLANLSNCKNLRHLPSTIASLKRLKTLDLCGCINLKQLPKDLGQMACLEELLLNGTTITRPPSSIVRQKNLKTLSFCRPTSLSNLTSSLFKWRSLKSSCVRLLTTSAAQGDLVWQCLRGSSFIKKLNLSYCDLYEIPGDLSQLYFLEELSLSGNEFTCLPASLCQLSKLKVLELKDCTRLVALKELPTSLAMLIMDDCKSLKSLGDLLTTKYEWLHEVSLSNCFKLTKNEQRSSSSCDRSSGFADMLLRTILQGRSVKNHKFSILVPGSEIPDWFTHQRKGKIFPDLQLLPNWHERIVGFAMCCVFRTTIPSKICIFLGWNHKMLIFNESWCQMISSAHLWMGYISLDFFREQFFGKYIKVEDWLGGTEESFLQIHPMSTCDGIKKCGINVVYRDDVKKHVTEIEEEEEEEDDDDSSQSAGNFASFPTKKGVGHFYFK